MRREKKGGELSCTYIHYAHNHSSIHAYTHHSMDSFLFFYSCRTFSPCSALSVLKYTYPLIHYDNDSQRLKFNDAERQRDREKRRRERQDTSCHLPHIRTPYIVDYCVRPSGRECRQIKVLKMYYSVLMKLEIDESVLSFFFFFFFFFFF